MKLISTNKKAFHDYEVLATYEAGIVLSGDEVKSIRAGKVSLNDAFATIHEGEVNIVNLFIETYSHAYAKSRDPRRTRKLLLKKREIKKLIGDISKKGLTLIPLKMYFNEKGYIKIEIGLARHKSAPSKKRELKERDIKRATEREMKIRLK